MVAIAAILIVSSCRLVPLTAMRNLWTNDKVEFCILIITWLACVYFDGATGLLLGAFLSLLVLAKKQTKSNLNMKMIDGHLTIQVRGSLNYVNCVDFETQITDKI